MANETDPVDSSEFVLRRFYDDVYKPGLPSPIQRGAFRPTKDDTTGISVYRDQFTTVEEILANIKEAKRFRIYVARLAVSEIRACGLTVIPNPDPDLQLPRGHALIPELSISAYESSSKSNPLKEATLQLAEIASRDIVHRPAGT